jgi:Ca2+-binding EF-hand superfamily protein
MAGRLLVPLWAVLAACFAAICSVEAQSPAGSERAAATRRVTEAQQAVEEAMAALAKAEQAVVGAEGEARKTSERLVQQARDKLEAARRELGRRNTELLNAAARDAAKAPVARPRRPYAPPSAEREDADPGDPVERFALLTPGGPVVVQVSLTIDGQPFRQARERLIDEMLTAADKDEDGQVTWDEAMASPRFAASRMIAKGSDLDGDGVVNRPELRRFVAARHQAPAFLLQAAPNPADPSNRVFVEGQVMTVGTLPPNVQALLDRDGDGVLAEPEIAAAGERLKSRDADDNDLLEAAEFSRFLQAPPGLEAAMSQRLQLQPSLICVLLGPAISADSLYTVLSQRYMVETGAIKSGSFSAVPQLFELLDEDGDGKLQKFEASRLSEVEPQISLAVDLGYLAGGRGLSLVSLAPDLAKLKESETHLSLALEGVLLSVAANAAAPPRTDYERAAGPTIARFDKDSNGYLGESEVPAGMAGQFKMWDTDGDGLVYAKEIAAAQVQTAAPRATQVVAYAASHGSSLFEILDQSGDSRLSLREMRSAVERIKLLDTDRDGQVTEREIPAIMSVSFRTGLAGAIAARAGERLPEVDSPKVETTPEWFTRMDRNGDGDLSVREFLGDRNDFRRLDADGDGLIDSREALAAMD